MKIINHFLLLCIFSAASLNAEFVVGVWNIEKLSSKALRGFPELKNSKQHPPRTTAQLQLMASYIEDDLKVDALIITEIDDDGDGDQFRPRSAQLDVVVDHLGEDWEYYLGRTGGDLRIGFLFNKDRVKIKKITNMLASEYEVQGEDVFDRDPLIVWAQFMDGASEYSDVVLVGLHLKSQQHHTHNHLAAMAKVIGDLKTPGVREELGLPRRQRDEDDVIILGDLNDSSHNKTGFRFIFDYAESQGFVHSGGDSPSYPATRVNGSEIDHIFLSKDVERELYVPGSFKVHSASDVDEYRKIYSDHYPVTVELTKTRDDD